MDTKLYKKITPTVKDVITILGAGAVVTALVAFPPLGVIAKTALDIQDEFRLKQQKRDWEKYNMWRLRAVLKRLHEQKVVEVIEKDGRQIVVLTEKGKARYLKFRLEETLLNKPRKWDGKWRLLIYDISKDKKRSQQIFREFLKQLKFLKLQKSVYLYPYSCDDEIEYLRQYYGIGDEVLLLTVEKFENEKEYRKYFGL